MTQMQQNWIGTLVVLVACVGAWLSLVHAEEEESAMTLSEVVDLIKPFDEGCDPKPEISHIEEMVLNKEDASHESKCFRRCMLRQFEIMPANQMQFNETKTMEMMNMMFSDKEEQSKNIVSKCNQEPAGVSDECEVAHSISMCMLREMRSSSYKIPKVKE